MVRRRKGIEIEKGEQHKVSPNNYDRLPTQRTRTISKNIEQQLIQQSSPSSIGARLGDDEVEVLALRGLEDEARDHSGHAVHQQRAVVLDEAVAQLRDLRTRAQGHVRKALSSPKQLGFA